MRINMPKLLKNITQINAEKQLEADIRRVEIKYVQMDNPRIFPFRPHRIGIAPIGKWRMNGKSIRKNKIKSGIITEVR